MNDAIRKQLQNIVSGTFPNIAYYLLGFIENKGNFSTILRQQFIIGKQAELNDIKQFLIFNGFVNTKRQDYYNSEFGLTLEDMHDGKRY